MGLPYSPLRKRVCLLLLLSAINRSDVWCDQLLSTKEGSKTTFTPPHSRIPNREVLGFPPEEIQTSSNRRPFLLLTVTKTETSSLCPLSEVSGFWLRVSNLTWNCYPLSCGLCSAFFHLTCTRFTWGPQQTDCG